MKKIKENLIYIILIAIILAGTVYLRHNNKQEEINLENTVMIKEDKEENKEKIIVHIEGAVNSPGVIELEKDSRIIDIIEKAGGLTEEANTKNLNLAYKIEDGQKIYIPNINDEDETVTISKEAGQNVIKENEDKKSLININTASQTELEKLPGIGQSTALKIINYRKENGKFNQLEDLKKVEGIGEAKYKKISEYIYIN